MAAQASDRREPAILRSLRSRARGEGAVVALPESGDPRILRAAVQAADEDLVRPLLVGSPAGVAAGLATAARDLGLAVPDLPVLDPAADPDLDADAETLRHELLERGVRRGVGPGEVEAFLRDPLAYACLLVRRGRAEGAVMGAVAATADTLRAALRVVGVEPGSSVDPDRGIVSSCFLMALADGRTLVYADCGVVPQPDAGQLAAIACQAAEACRRLLGEEPRVALLSFSTHGSAEHPCLAPVRDAVGLLRTRRVDFLFDGELQADAALIAAVGRTKAPGSAVAGQANVLIFPDLNSGNIAYKLTERLAGARAIGPLLQGLQRPVHDLSRGCSTEDVLDTLAITALDARRSGGRRRTS